ncbi:hypothetical protein SCB71_21250 (plasmid) [Herbiconiux sp. KACC 21604]|uniref:hypothetical protein n=1 Tax=unclassified Herbiconiux TaxID=2618217 RepID=UPI0014912CAC|nr:MULTISPECIES: hypothetical protein [unclassified Herbiconiux]QJU56272.1 hypothetical protein HL652_21045 [Herbiconiux sp. SALV-R1]WPO88777.1 hypothetical protein SCB71_21250 [Herbiconiux sp. KACC 21604]
MLNFDLSIPPRSPGDLEALATAVFLASPGDETHFLEWKSTLDLTGAAGQYAIARTIIGMFNRPVDLARTAFEGVGYMLVGAEPGNVAGTIVPDSAVVTSGISKYLAGPKIAWYHLSITVQGRDVLVIIVESPKGGDRIASLGKTFQSEKGKGADAGTIFVRTTGQTLPATPADIQSLEDRLLDSRRAPSLAVTCGLKLPKEGFFVLNDTNSDVDKWIDQRRDELLATERARTNPGLHRDTRTPSEFKAEVDTYARELREHAPAWARAIAYTIYNEDDAWALTIHNTGDEALRDVELVLTLPPGVEAHAFKPDHEKVKEPKPYNTQMPRSILDSVYAGAVPFVPDLNGLLHTSLDIQKEGAGWAVTASWKLVQAHKTYSSESFVLLGVQSGLSRPASFSATITARASNRRGVSEATVAIATDVIRTASIQQLIEL